MGMATQPVFSGRRQGGRCRAPLAASSKALVGPFPSPTCALFTREQRLRRHRRVLPRLSSPRGAPFVKLQAVLKSVRGGWEAGRSPPDTRTTCTPMRGQGGGDVGLFPMCVFRPRKATSAAAASVQGTRGGHARGGRGWRSTRGGHAARSPVL